MPDIADGVAVGGAGEAQGLAAQASARGLRLQAHWPRPSLQVWSCVCIFVRVADALGLRCMNGLS